MTSKTNQASPATPGDGIERRIALRAEVNAAAVLAAPLWPAETFIAVNPLLGLQSKPFEEAVRTARRELGANGYRSLAEFRGDLTAGRIDRHHLEDALIRMVSGLGELRSIATQEGEIDPIELLMADLTHGPECTPVPRPGTASARCDQLIGGDLAGAVDRLVSGWLSAYVDRSAAWQMPIKAESFWGSFRDLAPIDRGLQRLVGRGRRSQLKDLPEHPEDAIELALTDLGTPVMRRGDELRAQLMRLPGWAGHVKWRTEWATPDSDAPPIDIVELIAVRLTVERLAVAAALEGAARQLSVPATGALAAVADSGSRLAIALGALGVDADPLSSEARAQCHATLARIGDDDRLSIWLAAQEATYRDRLLEELSLDLDARDGRGPVQGRPPAQAVFCIDVRSEGIRRHLEQQGDCETLGFAGFFAVAIRFRGLGSRSASALCPVLLSPSVDVDESPAAGAGAAAERSLQRKAADQAASHAFHGAKGGIASPFALAEGGGLLAAPVAALRTFATGAMNALQRRSAARRSAPTEVNVTASDAGTGGFSEEEQVLFAHAALTMMGLTGNFGRLVALCAHGSHTVNNPYASALDCGACGGNQGGPNARVAAAILNREPVRKALAAEGIEIPDDTWFLAAQHDTTSDMVTVLDPELVPETHSDDLAELQRQFAAAGASLAAERAERIPGARAGARGTRMAARGNDWAQVRPEWGLAGNAAFIVGDRALTGGLDLGCRTFLHSYRAECDPDGSALEVILTAPLVVAQWINSQYYFSSVDPELFGAGDKTLHNVTGAKGIVQGGGGDLRVGLPWQSVAVGEDLVHEPLRLLAVVEAPIERIERIIGDNKILQELFGGGWISLVARDGSESRWMTRSRAGTWSSWEPVSQSDSNGKKEVVA